MSSSKALPGKNVGIPLSKTEHSVLDSSITLRLTRRLCRLFFSYCSHTHRALVSGVFGFHVYARLFSVETARIGDGGGWLSKNDPSKLTTTQRAKNVQLAKVNVISCHSAIIFRVLIEYRDMWIASVVWEFDLYRGVNLVSNRLSKTRYYP